jgi:hypothetical protein
MTAQTNSACIEECKLAHWPDRIKLILDDNYEMLNLFNGFKNFSVDDSLRLQINDAGINVTGQINQAKNVAKVWIKFDGQGQQIDASYNVSSLGDWGTGNYGVYIATDINTNYSAMVGTTQAQIGSVQLNNTQPNGV